MALKLFIFNSITQDTNYPILKYIAEAYSMRPLFFPTFGHSVSVVCPRDCFGGKTLKEDTWKLVSSMAAVVFSV